MLPDSLPTVALTLPDALCVTRTQTTIRAAASMTSLYAVLTAA